MRYVLAKVKDGHWHYYIDRTHWTPDLNDATLILTKEQADAHRALLPDCEDLGRISVVPIRLVPLLSP